MGIFLDKRLDDLSGAIGRVAINCHHINHPIWHMRCNLKYALNELLYITLFVIGRDDDCGFFML